MFTSTTTAVVNSVNSFGRKSSRPSISSIRSNSNRRTSSGRNYSPRRSCTEQTSGLSEIAEMSQESFQQILNNQPPEEFAPPMLRYDFQCRKSVYATMFAVFLVTSILFVMLYLRCYDLYMQVSHEQCKQRIYFLFT